MMVTTGASNTLLACGAAAPSSLSLAMSCLSVAFDTFFGLRVSLNVLSES